MRQKMQKKKLFRYKNTIEDNGDHVPILPELVDMLSDRSQIDTSPLVLNQRFSS